MTLAIARGAARAPFAVTLPRRVRMPGERRPARRAAAIDRWWGPNLHLGAGGEAAGASAPRLRRADAELVGHPHQLGERAGAELLHHLRAVGLDRAFGDAELGGDLLVAIPRDDAREHLALARGEPAVALAQRAGVLALRPPRRVGRQRRLDRGEQL